MANSKTTSTYPAKPANAQARQDQKAKNDSVVDIGVCFPATTQAREGHPSAPKQAGGYRASRFKEHIDEDEPVTCSCNKDHSVDEWLADGTPGLKAETKWAEETQARKGGRMRSFIRAVMSKSKLKSK